MRFLLRPSTHAYRGLFDFALLSQCFPVSSTEGIELCTEGFFNRASDIVNSFQEPKNLNELLYQARSELVRKVANTMAITQEQQIHAVNQTIDIAVNEGLGIEKNFNDPYSSDLKTSVTKEALQVSRYAPEEFRPSCLRNSFA